MKVIAVKIIDRIKEAGKVQSVLSKYSSEILTRLGFHEVTDAVCSREAVIILQVKDSAKQLIRDLLAVGGASVCSVDFDSNGTDTNFGYEPDSAADIIVFVTVKNRVVVEDIQDILTSYGCNIRTRLGISIDDNRGLIILELLGDDKQRLLMENDLKCVEGIDVRKMVF